MSNRELTVSEQVEQFGHKFEADLVARGFSDLEIENISAAFFETIFVKIPKGDLPVQAIGIDPILKGFTRYQFYVDILSGVYASNPYEVQIVEVALRAAA